MLQIKLRYLLFITSLLLAGCDMTANTALEKRLDAANAQITSLQNNLAAYKQNTDLNELVAKFDKVAYLTPGSDGYSPVKFDLGKLTVQLADVKPYANGSKVTLKFGNILSASINGLKTTIDWGRVDAKGTPMNESAKSKEVIFIETLRAGAWTPVSVVLDGIPPNELGFVRVRDITHTGINLFK